MLGMQSHSHIRVMLELLFLVPGTLRCYGVTILGAYNLSKEGGGIPAALSQKNSQGVWVGCPKNMTKQKIQMNIQGSYITSLARTSAWTSSTKPQSFDIEDCDRILLGCSQSTSPNQSSLPTTNRKIKGEGHELQLCILYLWHDVGDITFLQHSQILPLFFKINL